MRKVKYWFAGICAVLCVGVVGVQPASATTVYLTNSGNNDYFHRSYYYSLGSGTRYLRYFWYCDYGVRATMSVIVEADDPYNGADVRRLTETALTASGALGFTARSGVRYRLAGTWDSHTYAFTANWPYRCSFTLELSS